MSLIPEILHWLLAPLTASTRQTLQNVTLVFRPLVQVEEIITGQALQTVALTVHSPVPDSCRRQSLAALMERPDAHPAEVMLTQTSIRRIGGQPDCIRTWMTDHGLDSQQESYSAQELWPLYQQSPERLLGYVLKTGLRAHILGGHDGS